MPSCPPPDAPPPIETPETFPMSCEEYALTTPGVGAIWGAGLVVFAGAGERTKEEWDTLLAAFKDRPVR